MNNVQEQSAPKQIQFNNNPFSLAFNAMSQAFKINQNPAIVIIVGSLTIWAVNQLFNNVPNPLDILASTTSNESARLTLQMISLAITLLFIVISIVVSTVWSGFMAFVGLKNARFENTAVMPAFKYAFSKFWTIIGINIIIGLIVFTCFLPSIVVGTVGGVLLAADLGVVGGGILTVAGLLFIAGLFFAVRLSLERSLSLYASFDESLGVMAAIKRSTMLTKSRVMEAWGMALPGAIIPVIGPLLTSCGLGAHYLQLKVYRDNGAELPKPHWLVWLPLFFMIIAILFMALFIALIIFIAGSNEQLFTF